MILHLRNILISCHGYELELVNEKIRLASRHWIKLDGRGEKRISLPTLFTRYILKSLDHSPRVFHIQTLSPRMGYVGLNIDLYATAVHHETTKTIELYRGTSPTLLHIYISRCMFYTCGLSSLGGTCTKCVIIYSALFFSTCCHEI